MDEVDESGEVEEVEEVKEVEEVDEVDEVDEFESKLEGKIDFLAKLVTQFTTNQRSASPSAFVARLCAICPSSDHYTDACPSLQHHAAFDAPQAYATNIYNNRQQKQQQQQQMQFYDAPAQIAPQPSTSKPTLKELLEQMTMQNLLFKQEIMEFQQETEAVIQSLNDQIGQTATQLNQEQPHDLEESPFQTVQILDDDNVVHIGDGEQSYELTTEQPTFLPSDVHTLAPEETNENLEDQAEISSNFEPGRPFSCATTFPIFREVAENIPEFDYAVDDYAFNDYAVERYVDDHIVAEHVFNSSSVHDENHFLISHPNVYSPCTEHESESVIDITCNLEIDSCSEDVSEVQLVTLGLGVI
ncbi:hypothetical protein VIGAN_UM092000 [Vigna angularis var. angularis]|uniref:Uncharacterized protein n=1 Tax=Vigna angularis var. angularis TaxID=157739 RepID=A0A0S3TE61_PHAAN|nr:hypothetical protein VIGAN_UM092000 [Vigna angularis var. angularis]